MRFNQVLGAARVAAFVLCVMLAMLLAATSFAATERLVGTDDRVSFLDVDAWELPLGTLFECYALTGPVSNHCVRAAKDCNQLSEHLCNGSYSETQCPHEDSHAGYGEQTLVGPKLQVNLCVGTFEMVKCKWVVQGATQYCDIDPGAVVETPPCGGFKKAPVKPGCVIQN